MKWWLRLLPVVAALAFAAQAAAHGSLQVHKSHKWTHYGDTYQTLIADVSGVDFLGVAHVYRHKVTIGARHGYVIFRHESDYFVRGETPSADCRTVWHGQLFDHQQSNYDSDVWQGTDFVSLIHWHQGFEWSVPTWGFGKGGC